MDLVARETSGKKYSEKDAALFGSELAKHLAIGTENVQPVFENIFYFLWSEGNVLVNINPLTVNLKDSTERRTLAQLLDKGLDKPAGYVM